MNVQTRETLGAYYKEAESWGRDREAALARSQRIAWYVAAGAMAVAVMEAIALIVLMPLKTVEPYTLLVDRQTGFVRALDPINPARVSGDAALTQSFLVQYVIAREGFDVDSVQTDYRKVALWSGETARSSYINAMQASNPDSPLVRYPRSTKILVRVKSVSPLGPNVAMVRFETRQVDGAGQAPPPRAWAAIVRYRYAGEPMSIEDRHLNPLGFQVLHYRRDPEALPTEPQEQAAPPAPDVARPGAAAPRAAADQGGRAPRPAPAPASPRPPSGR